MTVDEDKKVGNSGMKCIFVGYALDHEGIITYGRQHVILHDLNE